MDESKRMGEAGTTPGRDAELRRAAADGDLSSLQTALDAKAAIDSRDANGRTALMLATLNGQTRVVEVLLAQGADPNAVDSAGQSPLQAALARQQFSIATALRHAGAH